MKSTIDDLLKKVESIPDDVVQKIQKQSGLANDIGTLLKNIPTAVDQLVKFSEHIPELIKITDNIA